MTVVFANRTGSAPRSDPSPDRSDDDRFPPTDPTAATGDAVVIPSIPGLGSGGRRDLDEALLADPRAVLDHAFHLLAEAVGGAALCSARG